MKKRERERTHKLARRGGPLAAPAARPRSCTAATRRRMKDDVAEMNTTHSSGRLYAYKQPWESREAEALGYVDDQYAHRDDPESEGEVQYDSDGEYRPADEEKPRTKSAMAKERLEEERERVAPANVARMRRLMMIPSDDDDSDDEGALAPPAQPFQPPSDTDDSDDEDRYENLMANALQDDL